MKVTPDEEAFLHRLAAFVEQQTESRDHMGTFDVQIAALTMIAYTKGSPGPYKMFADCLRELGKMRA